MSALDTGDKKAVLVFEELAMKRRKCKNIVLGKRNVLEQLAKSKHLSEPIKEIYRIIANRASESRLILSTVKKYCRIMGNPICERTVYHDGQEIIQVSIKEMIDLDLMDLTIIVTENPDDVQLYYIIGQYYMKHFKFGNLKIDFEERAGGGDTTARVLEAIINEKNRMCFCIVDSDKKYKGASPGNTMGKIMNIAENYPQKFYEVILMELQEIENLIPLSVIEHVGKNISNAQKGIDFYKFLVGKADNEGQTSYYYFDIKKGIPQKYFVLKNDDTNEEKRTFRKKENYRKYWEIYIKEYLQIIDAVGEYTIPGVCEKILKHAIEYFSKMIKEEKFDSYEVDAYIENVWLEYGAKIVSWGCVGNRIAT